MRRFLCVLMAMLLLLSVCFGCTAQDKTDEQDGQPAVSDSSAEPVEPEPVKANVYDDGRDRPSNSGALQVINGKLCSESGEPVMLRGVSSYGLMTSELFFNEPLFREMSEDMGINVYRAAMYTYGVGIVGYCADGDKERHKEDIDKCVEYGRIHDMYVIIDWHILDDGDPNTYVEEAKLFFAEMAEKYADHNNVIYEICNEPNGVDWAPIKSYAEQVIPVIREKDPNAVIIVGNPDWSKDLNAVMADPLDFDNILYTFHFYAATHKDDWRATVENCSQNGLPIFVTEYGVTASSGGFPRDLEGADTWIELLEKENISHVMWTFSNVGEPHAIIKPNVTHYNNYTAEDFSKTGEWFLEMLKKYND